jgi:hypothetical protein
VRLGEHACWSGLAAFRFGGRSGCASTSGQEGVPQKRHEQRLSDLPSLVLEASCSIAVKLSKLLKLSVIFLLLQVSRELRVKSGPCKERHDLTDAATRSRLTAPRNIGTKPAEQRMKD